MNPSIEIHSEGLDNLIGNSYLTRKIALKYEMNYLKTIKKCAQNLKICGDHGACENLMGSYQCICEPGYEPDHTGKQCVDVNECDDPLNCRKGQCRNTPGGFQCVCPSGMKYNEETKGK